MIRIAVLLLGLGGCYRVTIVADPLVAMVQDAGGAKSNVPMEVKMAPSFRAERLTVRAAGYRPTELALRWKPLRWLGPPLEVEVHLVSEHGPAGTWSR